MSDASAADPRDPARYIPMWAEILAQVLGEIAGASVSSTVILDAPAEIPPAGDTDFWIMATASGTVRGEMSLRLPPTVTVRLAQTFIGEPASAVEVTAEHREAVLELLRQVSGLAATAVKSTWGDVQLHLDVSPGAPSWPASTQAWIHVGDDPATLIEVQLSAALVAALRTEIQPEPQLQQPESGAAVSAPAAPSAPSTSHDDKVNLDLLLDVELAVTLRFGSRRLPLRDILDLAPGAVVDLDRRVQEPVDMLLNGRVVARGEVVVVDGDYGLRVTEVTPAI